MLVTQYQPDSIEDLNLMRVLIESRGMQHASALLADLPHYGFVAKSEEGKPIAAGFMRLMEEGYGLMDSHISHPDFSSDERHEAFMAITTHLIDLAHVLELKRVMAFSPESSLIDRVCSFGFKRVPYEFCILDLPPPPRKEL